MARLIKCSIVMLILVSLIIVLLPGYVKSQKGALTGELPKAIVIATHPVGTATYTMNAGHAKIIMKYTGMRVIVEPTAGGVIVEFRRLRETKADLVMSGAREGFLARLGEEEFKEIGAIDLNMLGYLNYHRYLGYTKPGTGIKSFKDLEGKKFAYETPGIVAAVETGRCVLEYYGLADKVIKTPPSDAAGKVIDLIEGRIDACWFPVNPSLLELKEAVKEIVVLEVPKECSDWIHKKKPFYAGVPTIPGLNGLEKSYNSVGFPTAFFCRADANEQMIYSVVKTLYDHYGELSAIHPSLKECTLSRAVEIPQIMPFHSAAIKYFKEKGVWRRELEDQQQRLLK